MSDRFITAFWSPEGIMIGATWASAALVLLVLIVFALEWVEARHSSRRRMK